MTVMKKIASVAAIAVAGVTLLAGPASASGSATTRVAQLTDADGKVVGTATLSWDGSKWVGGVQLQRNVLRPGKYVYDVDMMNSDGNNGGDVLCALRVQHNKAPHCTGSSPYMLPGFFGDVYNTAGVAPQRGPADVVYGELN